MSERSRRWPTTLRAIPNGNLNGHRELPSRERSPGRAEEGTQNMVKKLVFALVAGGIVFSASACNTVKGAGEDIESVGQAGDDAIN